MSILTNLEYQQPVIYDASLTFNGHKQYTSLRKSKIEGEDHHILSLFEDNLGDVTKQGFAYFFVNHDKKESQLIGVGIHPEFRNLGLATLLISNWIQLCLDNNIESLATTQKQRKPFLIYLIKDFGFDIHSPELYDTSREVISICRKAEEYTKYLYFKNAVEKANFQASRIMREDNYCILDELEEDVKVIDQVILRKSLYAQDNNRTYNRALEKYNQYRSR